MNSLLGHWSLTLLPELNQALVASSVNPVGTVPLVTSACPKHVQPTADGTMLPGSLTKACTGSSREGPQPLPHIGDYQKLRAMLCIEKVPGCLHMSLNIITHPK